MSNPERNVPTPMLVRAVLLVLAGLVFAAAASLEKMPHVAGTNLSGQEVEFPSVCLGSGCVIVMGFSHASQSQAKAWMDRADAELRTRSGLRIYSIAVLEDAPRFVRGMAVHGMKGSVPASQRARFVVVYQGESELKRLVDFRSAADAYILVVTRSADVTSTMHRKLTDAAFSALKTQISRQAGE